MLTSDLGIAPKIRTFASLAVRQVWFQPKSGILPAVHFSECPEGEIGGQTKTICLAQTIFPWFLVSGLIFSNVMASFCRRGQSRCLVFKQMAASFFCEFGAAFGHDVADNWKKLRRG